MAHDWKVHWSAYLEKAPSRTHYDVNSLVQNLFWVKTVDTRNTFALFAPSSYSDAVKQITRMFVDTCVV